MTVCVCDYLQIASSRLSHLAPWHAPRSQWSPSQPLPVVDKIKQNAKAMSLDWWRFVVVTTSI